MFVKLIKVFLLVLTLQITLQAREINIDNIIKTAKNSNKHLFVWLHKTDCGYCENMKEFTLNNETIQSFIEKNFIFVHINISEKDEVTYQDFKGNAREFAQEVGYDFYPTSLFFDENEEVVYTEVGFVDSIKMPHEERFYKILNFIESKSYENIDYYDYKFKNLEEL